VAVHNSFQLCRVQCLWDVSTIVSDACMHACMHVKHGSAHATDCSQIAKAAVSGKAICKQLMLVAQCKCMQITR